MQKLKIVIITLLLAAITASLGAVYLFNRYSKDLPDYEQLKSYTPLITTRLYDTNGELIREFSKENRIFVSINTIPKNLINAFLAAEDSHFYKHSGIDFGAILRTSVTNIFSFMKGDGITGGGSTITQQVVKNFLLTNEKTITRKIKEAVLAFKMTKTFSKDKILELYLNQIYLGSGSYGVAAAAQAYFDKSIDDLTIEEAALLATLPKAPSKLDPRKNIEKAKIRRDWVINRMLEEGFIDRHQARDAINTPIKIKPAENNVESAANSFSDNVKKELTSLYGSDDVFESGIVVRTTLDSKLQKIAREALQKGIEDYDRRHGYRGALTNLKITKDDENWVALLKKFEIKQIHKDNWTPAVVLDSGKNKADIGFVDGKKGIISLENIKWARKYLGTNALGKSVKSASEVLKVGDVVLVEKINGNSYDLKQIPQVNGAVMAIDPHSGKVLAMSGGYIDAANQFNRATQAQRQPGSVLKTFGYIAALENGLTPATIMMDEPIILDQGDDSVPYTPSNYSGKFYGPTTLRKGLEQSINVTTVRAASQVGLDKVTEVIRRFRVNDNPEQIYSLVLGSTETTLSRLVTSYAMIVNGGRDIRPFLIEKIQDRQGKTLFRRDKRKCDCNFTNIKNPDINKLPFPILEDNRGQITDSATAYQITSMLEGVVKRGTAMKARSIGKIIGGKTGTTNNSYDSWFVGFSPDLVFGVYVGFDIPASLGREETGASVALPIFIDFMTKALEGVPSTPFRIPSSVKLVRVDMDTGRAPTPSTPENRIIYEVLKLGDKLDGEVLDPEQTDDTTDDGEEKTLDSLIDEINAPSKPEEPSDAGIY